MEVAKNQQLSCDKVELTCSQFINFEEFLCYDVLKFIS